MPSRSAAARRGDNGEQHRRPSLSGKHERRRAQAVGPRDGSELPRLGPSKAAIVRQHGVLNPSVYGSTPLSHGKHHRVPRHWRSPHIGHQHRRGQGVSDLPFAGGEGLGNQGVGVVRRGCTRGGGEAQQLSRAKGDQGLVPWIRSQGPHGLDQPVGVGRVDRGLDAAATRGDGEGNELPRESLAGDLDHDGFRKSSAHDEGLVVAGDFLHCRSAARDPRAWCMNSPAQSPWRRRANPRRGAGRILPLNRPPRLRFQLPLAHSFTSRHRTSSASVTGRAVASLQGTAN